MVSVYITQKKLSLLYCCMAVPHVPRPEFAVNGLYRFADAMGFEVIARLEEQFVQRGAVAYGVVVDLVQYEIHV